jgi:N6-adenosine-specific RNA methylase IME4
MNLVEPFSKISRHGVLNAAVRILVWWQMRKINIDYLRYMEKMGWKDFVITDAPWNLGDKPPKATSQLKYELWKDNVAGMVTIFQNVKTDLLFVWVINAVIQELFEAVCIYNWTEPNKRRHWRNKNKFGWIKLTNLGNNFYGTGHWNRNCSEELFIFARPSCKPTRLSLRSHFKEERRDKTVKPIQFELQLISDLRDRGLMKSAYIFSGTDPEKMSRLRRNKFDIDCVDIEHGR